MTNLFCHSFYVADVNMGLVWWTASVVGSATMLGAILGFLIKKYPINSMTEFWVLDMVID